MISLVRIQPVRTINAEVKGGWLATETLGDVLDSTKCCAIICDMKTLKDFATAAGVTIVEVSPGWGGKIGYKSADWPNSTICGFRTESAAYKHWLTDTFGKQTSKAIMKLLKEANK